jgi:tetratricopeptide (TPR) repeat protein
MKGYGEGIYGFVLINAGKYNEALTAFCNSIATFTEIGERYTVPAYICGLAEVYLHLGDYKSAKQKAEEGFRLALEVDSSDDASYGIYILGGIDLVEDRFEQASSKFKESKRLMEIDYTPPDNKDAALTGLGLVALKRGDRSLAKHYLISELIEALEDLTHHRAKDALLGFALLFADQGQEEEAVRLHALVNRCPYVSKSRWYADIAGDHLATVAARLPATIAEQAREQGRNLDLWDTVRGIIGEATDRSNNVKESL